MHKQNFSGVHTAMQHGVFSFVLDKFPPLTHLHSTPAFAFSAHSSIFSLIICFFWLALFFNPLLPQLFYPMHTPVELIRPPFLKLTIHSCFHSLSAQATHSRMWFEMWKPGSESKYQLVKIKKQQVVRVDRWILSYGRNITYCRLENHTYSIHTIPFDWLTFKVKNVKQQCKIMVHNYLSTVRTKKNNSIKKTSMCFKLRTWHIILHTQTPDWQSETRLL